MVAGAQHPGPGVRGGDLAGLTDQGPESENIDYFAIQFEAITAGPMCADDVTGPAQSVGKGGSEPADIGMQCGPGVGWRLLVPEQGGYAVQRHVPPGLKGEDAKEAPLKPSSYGRGRTRVQHLEGAE